MYIKLFVFQFPIVFPLTRFSRQSVILHILEEISHKIKRKRWTIRTQTWMVQNYNQKRQLNAVAYLIKKISGVGGSPEKTNENDIGKKYMSSVFFIRESNGEKL